MILDCTSNIDINNNHAYDELYIEDAQKNVGNMLDFAVNTLNLELSYFWERFLESKICKQIEVGESTYVVGKTGCELADLVLNAENSEKYVLHLNKSPEYWCGWTLTYYQWLRNVTFKSINDVVSIEEVQLLYDTMHEMDIQQFVDYIDNKFKFNVKSSLY